MSHSHSQIHLDIQHIIAAALEQPLDAETQAIVDQHIAACVECRLYAERLQKLDTRLSDDLQARWPARP